MVFIRGVNIQFSERGLVFRNGRLESVLGPGRHWLIDLSRNLRVDVVSVRIPKLEHGDLELLVREGVLGEEAKVVDVKDHERALIWVDGRFSQICAPGIHVFWSVFHEIRAEMIDARKIRFDHPELSTIVEAPGAGGVLECVVVDNGHKGLLLRNERIEEELSPGRYALWRNVGRTRVLHVDLRRQSIDIAGQEIMTADKVSLRMNALVSFRVVDPRKAVTAEEDFSQALYRAAQLALRAVVGTRELDTLLADKDAVADELTTLVRSQSTAFGVEVEAMGIRDLILPGEMRTLLNRVTEAKKAAEANLIARREETAAMRSQANTARLLDANPTLMRLRELEVLEKVADKANLNVVLGETGLSDRIVKLI